MSFTYVREKGENIVTDCALRSSARTARRRFGGGGSGGGGARGAEEICCGGVVVVGVAGAPGASFPPII